MIRSATTSSRSSAVFLALATGVALGGGPLADDPVATRRAAPRRPRRQPDATYADTFAGLGAARLYADGLVAAPRGRGDPARRRPRRRSRR